MNTQLNHFDSSLKGYAQYLSKLSIVERERAINAVRTGTQGDELRNLVYQVKAEQLITLPVTLLACALKQIAEKDLAQFKAVTFHLFAIAKGNGHAKQSIA
ncbi:MAG: hypothetical protein RPT25_06555 [Cycloclasticus sp.]